MKSVLGILLVIWAAVAECAEYYPISHIYWDIPIDKESIPAACDSIDKFQIENFYDYSCDENSILYASPLDTTVSFGMVFDEGWMWLDRYTQNCEGAINTGFQTVGTAGSHSFSEVLYTELMRWQGLGIVEMEKDSAEQFVLRVIETMKNISYCEDIDMATYYGENSGKLYGNYGCCSLVDTSTSILKISPMIGNVRIEKVSTGKFQISGVPAGTAYSVFNLNGQLISKGLVGNGLLDVPVERAVLKIGSKWFEL